MEKLTIWILLTPMVSGLFHENSQHQYNYSLPEKSLFGYSIAYIPSYKSLIVSAPMANNIGQVFSIIIDSEEIKQINITQTQEMPITEDRGFWLGASVKSIKDFFVACAPRRTKRLLKAFVAGVCYITKMGNVTREMPEISQKDRLISTELGTFEQQMDTFGWSLDITQKDEVLVGGPGMTGRVSIYKHPFSNNETLSNEKPQLIYTKGSSSKSESTTFNFGYSVVSGNFSDKMQYAVSSTYGTKGFGKIYFYDSSFNNVETIVDQEENVGSMFGAALCAVDLGAERVHLLVGAPVYSETFKYDVGTVYLYVADSTSDDKMIFKKKISGTSSGGYFGNTIITLGDLDNDGKDEVAIGAPYENEYEGAVYIYTGAVLDNPNSGNIAVQIIRPRGKLQYFGFSLTTLQDNDGNGCNELAVGAPGSNAVVLFRSFASVKITIGANLINVIRENKTSVVFESCLEVTYPQKPQKIIGDIIVKVEAPNGPYSLVDATDGILTYTISLNKTLPIHCKNITVSIEKNLDLQTVTYTIKAELEEDPRNLTAFNASQVLLSSQSILSKSGHFIITDCDGKVCRPVLKTNFSSSMPHEEYTIGSSDLEWFSLSITNGGDIAYGPCIEFEVIGASILQHPLTCRLKDFDIKRIICSPSMALHNGADWNTGHVLLETKDITSLDETMEVRYDVYNHCNNQSAKASYSAEIILKSDFSFVLTGEALPEQKINITTSELPQPRTVGHLYKIKNNGLTNWVGVKSKIILPRLNLTNVPPVNSSYQIVVNNDGKHKYCPMNNLTPSDGCLTINCDIGNLFKTKEASVYITINVPSESIGSITEEQPLTLETNLHLLLKDITKSHSISTIIQLKNAAVPLWMIISAACVGLLILFIIAFLLYECGFLRRKNKVKLENLKTFVCRQSMRRSIVETTHAVLLKDIAEEAATLIASNNKLANNEEDEKDSEEHK